MKPPSTLLTHLAAVLIASGSATLSAQTQTAAASPEAAPGVPASEVIRMDQFEVSTTEGRGYVATNASEGFKTSESLMTIPQIDVVITSDVLNDIGMENLSDSLGYFGVVSQSSTSSTEPGKFPGGGGSYEDEFPVHAGRPDSRLIDSVELIKGGAEELYMLNSGLGGIVMKALKKPIAQGDTYASKNQLWVTSDQVGLWQTGIDSTGPIGKIGDVSIGYRVIADIQNGKSWLMNVVDNRKTLYPYLMAKYNNTIVRFHYELEQVTSAQIGQYILTPTGQLYTGGPAGREVSNNPPNNTNFIWNSVWEGSISQKFSENWEMRLSGQYFNQAFQGPQAITTGEYWGPTPYAVLTARDDDQRWRYWTVVSDMSGKYDLGPANWEMRQTDVFGWAFTDQITYKYILSNTVYPFSDTARGITPLTGQAANTFLVPANNAAAVNAVVVPPASSYYRALTAAGSHTTVWNGGGYWQHTADLIPNWFSVTAGAAWINVITDNVTDISIVPWQATELHASEWVHRIAGSFYPLGNKELMIYALEATNFTPGTTVVYLATGAAAPPSSGKDHELGAKALFMGGRLSADFRWEEQVTSSVTVPVGVFPNGTSYSALVGQAVEEGVDGDLAVALLPGWQLIGSFYAGHSRDQNNNPVNGSWDNSWGALTRYDFPHSGPLRGLAVGVGENRLGPRFISTSGIVGATAYYEPFTLQTGFIKYQATDMMNAFASYAVNKHLSLSVYCTNVTNNVFPLDAETSAEVDSSPPRLFRFEADFKF